MATRKRKRNKTRVLIACTVILSLMVAAMGAYFFYMQKKLNMTSPYYLANDVRDVPILDENFNDASICRGTLVDIKNRTEEIEDIEYRIFEMDNRTFYVLEEYLETNRDDCVREESLYALRNSVLTKEYDSYLISGWAEKNSLHQVSGYHELMENGEVDYYELDSLGYMKGEYLSKEYYETAYDSSTYSYIDYGAGGSPLSVDYYPREVSVLDGNVMPNIVKALYINAEAISDVDSYLDIARESGGINAFVVDIKDCYIDTQLAYDSPTALSYAPSISNIPNSYDTYKECVSKIKEAGYYLIGRITAFKDDAFAIDNPGEALMYNGSLYSYGSVKWPSIFSRKMWEYNVALASEAVTEMGFDEIQFDYVRLPEDVEGVDLRNDLAETRVRAVTEFLRYASEQLHRLNAYVSADVFGEISGNDKDSLSCFVSYYGQFWPAISNTVDAISSMPYPDHFSDYSYGISEPWANPGELMEAWGKATKFAQDVTYDAAKCRTWIMAQSSDAYDVYYGPDFITAQIDGLKKADVFDGYMTWSASSNINRYWLYLECFN